MRVSRGDKGNLFVLLMVSGCCLGSLLLGFIAAAAAGYRGAGGLAAGAAASDRTAAGGAVSRGALALELNVRCFIACGMLLAQSE